MRKTLYISSEIFDWHANICASSIRDIKKIKRAYEILEHAQQLITKGDSTFNRADCLGNLKRALNHRLKLIECEYKLKLVEFTNKPKGYLEILEAYELAKPFVIKRLMQIRNDIEHEDKTPPTLNRCQELIDITWYFLKSTDRLVYYIPTDLELEHSYDSKYGGTLEVFYGKRPFKLSGWFPKTILHKAKVDNTLKLTCSVLHDGAYWKTKGDMHKDKTKDDIWLIANISTNEDERHLLLKKCFSIF